MLEESAADEEQKAKDSPQDQKKIQAESKDGKGKKHEAAAEGKKRKKDKKSRAEDIDEQGTKVAKKETKEKEHEGKVDKEGKKKRAPPKEKVEGEIELTPKEKAKLQVAKLKELNKTLRESLSSSKKEMTELRGNFRRHRHLNKDDELTKQYAKCEEQPSGSLREVARFQVLQRFKESEQSRRQEKEKFRKIKTSEEEKKKRIC